MATTRYNQDNIVAVVFDPEGGEHPCFDVTDERYDSAQRYWCAGMIGKSVAELADRVWDAWYRPSCVAREWDEFRAAEAMVP